MFRNNIFLDKTCFIILGDSIYFLLGILNSSIIEFHLRNSVVKLGVGSMGLAKIYIEQIPIPKVNQKTKDKIENLVKTIKQKKLLQDSTFELEKEIDKLVYELYELNENEIKIIEGK